MLWKLLRTTSRFAAAVAVFVVMALVTLRLGIAVGDQILARKGLIHEQRLVFNQDVARGQVVSMEVLSLAWAPENSPASAPWERRECLLGRRLLGSAQPGTLVGAGIVEGASECLAVPQADTRGRD